MPITDEQPLRALEMLQDPSPPTPGAAQRAAVSERARHLTRRRRAVQGVGTLACMVTVAAGVALLGASGGGSPSGTAKVDAASAVTGRGGSGDGGPAASTVLPEPVLPTVQVRIEGVPDGATLALTLVGEHGTFSTSTNTSEAAFDGVPMGDYEARWEWTHPDGSTAVGRFTVTVTDGENSFVLT